MVTAEYLDIAKMKYIILETCKGCPQYIDTGCGTKFCTILKRNTNGVIPDDCSLMEVDLDIKRKIVEEFIKPALEFAKTLDFKTIYSESYRFGYTEALEDLTNFED